MLALLCLCAADYHTFSRAGVTHFVGKGDSEFTSLEQWEREYKLFGQLHKIPFFKKYRLVEGEREGDGATVLGRIA